MFILYYECFHPVTFVDIVIYVVYGHNPVVRHCLFARVRQSSCPHTTYDRISVPDRDIRPAYSCRLLVTWYIQKADYVHAPFTSV